MTDATARLTAALVDRYTIERELGAGGMATVYLAHDVRHDRKVALKVLRPELAAVLGAERFVVEIRTTASLQHPHILPLFDSGTADGFLYYVMPFIDGETLREKLDRETQLGIDEAVRIATAVAEALDHAHRHGVIHRDIKPENILLHDGRPIVADFGIALAVSAAAGGRMTETGLSLGTPHYMSPEQATAEKQITARSDVYSLGSVLYEMLTGSPPHTGASAQQIIMKIVTEEAVPVTTLRKSVPAHVAAAVAKSIERLPADRFDSARAFAEALLNDRFTYGAAGAEHGTQGPAVPHRLGASRAALVLGGTLALAGLALAAWALRRGGADGGWPTLQLMLDVEGTNPNLARFAVSPDGAVFAFETDEGIAVRAAAQREFVVQPGTQGGEAPSFSPDGQWIVFHVTGRLRRIAVAGGSAFALVAGDSLLSGRPNWGADGSIVFEGGGRLYLIPAGGGPLRRLAGAVGAVSPRMLPDGSGVLYVDQRDGSKLVLYDIESDSSTTLLEESSEGQYVGSGHIVYGHPAGGLFAVRFDLRRRSVIGAPIPVASDMEVAGAVAPFEITRSGMLVYRAGLEPQSRLLLRDVRGRLDTLPLVPKVVSYLRFSPDGRALAMTVGSARGTNRHTAIYDLELGSLTQFTVEGGGHAPIWSPDGRRLAFSAESEDGSAEDLFVQPVDRSARPTRIVRLPNDQHANAWPAESLLVFADGGSPRLMAAAGDLKIVDPTAANASPRAYLGADWNESDLAVSPDGRFAAYSSNESGAPEIYVRRFPVPEAGGQWKVSSAGGHRARWSPDGRTVLHLGLDGRTIHAVGVRTEPSFAVVSRDVVLALPGLGTAWDVDRRSGRIVVSQAVASESARMVVVVNWLDWLRRATADAP